MGGRVEDDLGVVRFKNLGDAIGIADVGDHRDDVGADPAVTEFAIDFKQGVFGAIEKNQPGGTESHGLAADFRADASAGSGDE